MLKEYKKFYSKIDNYFQVKSKEIVHITKALARVTASDIKANNTLPDKDKAYIDGYAFASSIIPGYPATLEVAESYEHLDTNTAGQAIKVSNGDEIPQNMDSIIPLEEVIENDNFITIEQPILCGENIYYLGIDFNKDDIIIDKGHLLKPRDLGISAAMNVLWLPVVKQPSIAVLTIDNEFSSYDDFNNKPSIISSSMIAIGEISALNSIAINLGSSSASKEHLKEIIDEVQSDVDLLITIGGISSKSNQVLLDIIDRDKTEIDINVTKKESAFFIEKENVPILALPNNPISVQVCASLFLPNIIKKISGIKSINKKSYAVLGRNLDINDEKASFIAAKLVEEDERIMAIPISSYDRILMSSLKESDCAIVVDKEKMLEGDIVKIVKFNNSLLDI